MRASFAVIVCVAACRYDFGELPDAAPRDTSPPACAGQPFGARTLVPGVSDAVAPEGTMRLTSDELRGYLWIMNAGDADLYSATRADLTAPFVVAPLASLNQTGVADFEPAPDADELTIVFMSNRPGVGSFDLYAAERASVASSFTVDGLIDGIDTAAGENQPFLTPTSLYFVSDRAGDADLYVAPRTGRTTFDSPVRLDAVSEAGVGEADPIVSSDELTLYFSSQRSGGGDIYVATRASTSEPFGAPRPLTEVNTAAYEGPSWISADECRLYFTSDFAGTADVSLVTR